MFIERFGAPLALALIIAIAAAVSTSGLAAGPQPVATQDVRARSCPSGQQFDSVSGTCKTFFDIRGSFAVPLPKVRP